VQDVALLDLENTELVTLSGCETGLGDVFRGEGTAGFRRAFQIGGAKSLIVSLWAVRDDATALLMTDLYGRLLAGEPRAAALKAAKLTLRQKYRSPTVWGAFVLIGDWRELPPAFTSAIAASKWTNAAEGVMSKNAQNTVHRTKSRKHKTSSAPLHGREKYPKRSAPDIELVREVLRLADDAAEFRDKWESSQDTADLKRTVELYRKSIELGLLKVHPEVLFGIRRNLGAALGLLGVMTSDVAAFHEGASELEQALVAFSPKRSSYDYVAAAFDLGTLYGMFAERIPDHEDLRKELLRHAERYLQDASRVGATSGNLERARTADNNLVRVRSLLSRIENG
jgi:hypothetical protein